MTENDFFAWSLEWSERAEHENLTDEGIWVDVRRTCSTIFFNGISLASLLNEKNIDLTNLDSNPGIKATKEIIKTNLLSSEDNKIKNHFDDQFFLHLGQGGIGYIAPNCLFEKLVLNGYWPQLSMTSFRSYETHVTTLPNGSLSVLSTCECTNATDNLFDENDPSKKGLLKPIDNKEPIILAYSNVTVEMNGECSKPVAVLQCNQKELIDNLNLTPLKTAGTDEQKNLAASLPFVRITEIRTHLEQYKDYLIKEYGLSEMTTPPSDYHPLSLAQRKLNAISEMLTITENKDQIPKELFKKLTEKVNFYQSLIKQHQTSDGELTLWQQIKNFFSNFLNLKSEGEKTLEKIVPLTLTAHGFFRHPDKDIKPEAQENENKETPNNN